MKKTRFNPPALPPKQFNFEIEIVIPLYRRYFKWVKKATYQESTKIFTFFLRKALKSTSWLPKRFEIHISKTRISWDLYWNIKEEDTGHYIFQALSFWLGFQNKNENFVMFKKPAVRKLKKKSKKAVERDELKESLSNLI